MNRRRDDRLDLTRRQRRQDREKQSQQQQHFSSGPVDVDDFFPPSPQRQQQFQVRRIVGPQEASEQRARSAPKPREASRSNRSASTTAPTGSVRYTTPTTPFAASTKQQQIPKKPSLKRTSSAPRNPDVRRLPGSGSETAVYYHREAGVGFRPKNTSSSSDARHQAAAARYYATRVKKQQNLQQQQQQRPVSPPSSTPGAINLDRSTSPNQNNHHSSQQRFVSPATRRSMTRQNLRRSTSPLVTATSQTDLSMSSQHHQPHFQPQEDLDSRPSSTNDHPTSSTAATNTRSDDDGRSWTTAGTGSNVSDARYTQSLLDEAVIPSPPRRRNSEGRISMVDPNGERTTAFDEIAEDVLRKRRQRQMPTSSLPDLEPPESKYTRAIQHLAHQDTAIHMLQEQLHETKVTLAQTKRELQQSQSEVARRSHAMEQSSHETFQDRIHLEERLRNVLKHNQEHEAELLRWKQRVEQLEKELHSANERNETVQAMAVVVDQEEITRKAEEAEQMIQQLQSQVANLRNEKRTVERSFDEVTTLRDKAQTEVSQMARELVLAHAEADRWKKEAALWKKRSNEADALRTQLSAVRAVLGNAMSTPSPSSASSKGTKKTASPTQDISTIESQGPDLVQVSAAETTPAQKYDENAQVGKMKRDPSLRVHSPFFIGDVMNISAITTEAEHPSPIRNEQDAKHADVDRMVLSVEPSFDGSAHDLRDRTADEMEEEEMQDLIKQLNSMKETLSLSHSSETIEPPPTIQRNRSTNSIFSSGDESDYAGRSSRHSNNGRDESGDDRHQPLFPRSAFESDEDSDEIERMRFRSQLDLASF